MFCWLVEWHGCPRYFWFCCLSLDEKNGFAQICSLQNMSQIFKNGGVNMGKDGKCLDIYTTLFFGIHINFLLLHFYKFATYLQGANLCKSNFSSSVLKTAGRRFVTPPLVSPWNDNWVVTRHQCGISALLPHMLFHKETIAGCFLRLLV